ncbi:MAG: antirestriction protein [Enterobacterales bacterium endosymbiont of Blomia tropicalis]|uniref:antirestriction protein n=1 Tax=Mixta mediterraneensis TaxID=2758443 RepID=UPI0025A7EA12|nr:antirestriction protein [Mixta mediterraneensis]MDL4916290.1 antirestriction protein [Mixta mediterraneensis]
MSNELNQPAITARIIPNNRRMAFLPRLFGAWYLTGEAGVYNHARTLCADYQGGSWEFVELSCGSGFMYPLSAERFTVSVSGNWFEGELSAEATGIVLTLFMVRRFNRPFLNLLTMNSGEEELHEVRVVTR